MAPEQNWYAHLKLLDSWKSKARLADRTLLYPPLNRAIGNLLHEARKKGLNVDVFETFRSPERQVKLYNEGRSKIKAGGYHQFGLAADLVLKDAKGNWTWDNPKGYDLLATLAVREGLDPGHFWKSFKDSPHMQSNNAIVLKKQWMGV